MEIVEINIFFKEGAYSYTGADGKELPQDGLQHFLRDVKIVECSLHGDGITPVFKLFNTVRFSKDNFLAFSGKWACGGVFAFIWNPESPVVNPDELESFKHTIKKSKFSLFYLEILPRAASTLWIREKKEGNNPSGLLLFPENYIQPRQNIFCTLNSFYLSNPVFSLLEKGFSFLTYPLIRFRSLPFKLPDGLMGQGPENKYLLFSSQRGVEYFLKGVERKKMDGIRCTPCIAVGKRTGKILTDHGFKIAFIPEKQRLDEVAKWLEEIEHKPTVYFFKAREGIELKVAKNSCDLVLINIYETDENKIIFNLDRLVDDRAIDVIILSSPSSVKSYFGQSKSSSHPALVPFGPSTGKSIEEKGESCLFMPEKSGLDQILKELQEYWGE
ncbi:uroporphyrinogen-III synthase [Candidatus Riflebacteria bacterium]